MAENFVLEKQIIEKSKIMSCKINDINLRKRAFVLSLAANATSDFLNKSGVRVDIKLSLYRVASFAQNLEIADIYVEGKRLDVRVTFDGEIFTVPKVHEKYDAQPCAYVVLKLDKSMQNVSLLGFVSSKDLPKVKSETEYFEYGVSILQPISELGDFLAQVELEQKIYSSADHEKIKELALAFIDDEISESEKVYFIKHVVACPVCREVFCDTNDFDVVVSDVKNYPELLSDSTLSVLSGNKQEVDEAVIANMAVLENEMVVPESEVSVDFLNDIEKEENNYEDVDLVFPEAPVPAAPVEFFDEISLDFEDSSTENEVENVEIEEAVLEESIEQSEDIEQDDDLILPMGVPQDVEPVLENIEEEILDENENSDSLDNLEEVAKENLIQEELIEETELSEFVASEELLEEDHMVMVSEDDLLIHEESTEEVVLEQDDTLEILNQDEELDILNNDAEFILEEHEEGPVSLHVEEPQPEKKAYDFSLETEVQNEPQEDILLEEVSEQNNVEEQLVEEKEETIYPMSVQEPVELVYDDEDDDELEESHVDTEEENTLVEAVDEKLVEDENEVEQSIGLESIEPVVAESNIEEPVIPEASSQDDIQNTNVDLEHENVNDENKEDEIQQLLDDDLLALLAEDNTETVVVQESQDSVSLEGNQDIQQTQSDLNSQDGSIEALYDEPQAQENGQQKEFELAQEPVSEKTVNATKRLLVLLALLIMVAGGGAGMLFMNNAKNQAENLNEGLNQDAEVFDMQNKVADSQAPAISQDINKSMTNSFSDKPAAITITKLSWQISEKLATDDSVKEYLQTAGKNIQMNLQNDLANSADVNFNNIVKVSFEISPENEFKGIQVLESSGSDQIDDIIVRGIKNTLKYVSVPKVKDYDSDYFLTLIINF